MSALATVRDGQNVGDGADYHEAERWDYEAEAREATRAQLAADLAP